MVKTAMAEFVKDMKAGIVEGFTKVDASIVQGFANSPPINTATSRANRASAAKVC